MKATELMIGDWIDVGYHDYNKVQEIGRDNDLQWYISFACGVTLFSRYEFGPVPITPEILEKNGWKKESYMQPPFDSFVRTYYFVKDEGNTHIEFKCNTLTIWFDYKENNDGVYSDILVPCEYVHQLQQVLRLAGMTELANNFKVK